MYNFEIYLPLEVEIKTPLNATLSSKFGSYIFNQLNVFRLLSDFKAEDVSSPRVIPSSNLTL